MTSFLLSPPGETYLHPNPADMVRHNLTAPADADLAIQQHAALCDALRQHGAIVHLVDPLPQHPNSVFTQDCTFVLPEGYLHLRMGLPSRRGEADWLAHHLDALGVPCVGRIDAPGTAEGGDLILAGNTVFVGYSRRTNKEGLLQLQRIFAHLGYAMRIAEVPSPSLHIGGMLSALSPTRLLACASRFDTALFEGFEVITVPDTSFISGNVITVAEHHVIAEQRNTPAIEALDAAGVHVTPLDLGEFVKGTGGPSCLVCPLGD